MLPLLLLKYSFSVVSICRSFDFFLSFCFLLGQRGFKIYYNNCSFFGQLYDVQWCHWSLYLYFWLVDITKITCIKKSSPQLSIEYEKRETCFVCGSPSVQLSFVIDCGENVINLFSKVCTLFLVWRCKSFRFD
jgi:hypothetical protein